MKDLSNGILEIEVSETGAELQSLRRVASPHEYLWQGDAEYWDRRAPLLFPIVGKVWQNTLHVNGREYHLTQHGFLRDMTFECIVDEDRHLAFEAHSDDQSKELWPFDFSVRIDYTLLRNVLTVGWQVTNRSNDRMPFQIGAHPGFNYKCYCPDDDVHGFLSFDIDDSLHSTVIAPGGYAADETFDVYLPSDGMLPLTNHTFDCDTLVDATARIRRITLHDKNAHPMITVRHTMPITALWSPCGGKAPFMCIEPWHGCCDPVGFSDDVELKPFVEHVEPNQTWETKYEIIVE
ncbi:MAG: aldose 1-epimerase family protein [Bacteroidaceae bacterium]|nr:aldose 1-epimerase family protein [Bacteroidaceae bacterium]